MPVSYITYKGKQILYCDFRDMKAKQEVLTNLELMVKFYVEADKKILTLADVRGTYTDPEITEKIKYYGKAVFALKAEKRAIIGINALRRIVLRGYNLFTNNDLRPFETEEEAKEYLIS